ncbi:MAG: tetratricopeptide repeat protein [Chitinivibrionales bacterium]|nr:tetratricopeptide repeat protein [Chitinivibrionales bacterium]
MQQRITALPALVLVMTFMAARGYASETDSSFVNAVRKGIHLFDSAYNAWDTRLFRQANGHFEGMEKQYPASHVPCYWQGVVCFHLVSYYLFGFSYDRDETAAAAYIERGLAALERSLQRKAGEAESLALRGTMTGIRIFLNPLLAPVFGPKVMGSIEAAMSVDPANPRVQYLVGVSYYNTPALLGGGASAGMPYLLRAEMLYEREQEKPGAGIAPRWGRSTCLGFIGKGYMKKGEYPEARNYFTKALEVNPRDAMVRESMQELKKKKKKRQPEKIQWQKK